ncbi:MAG: helix-hairpin-helix domain-containing protein, partial [Sciscionella sp.]
GMARKSEYRRFAIREGAQRGDVGSIEEVTRRRFAAYLRETGEQGEPQATATGIEDAPAAGPGGAPQEAEVAATRRPGIDPDTGRVKRFAYPPNLYVVDGGAPQVAVASDVLAELGITDVAVIGLAKRLEEVWVPGEGDPVILPRTSEALYLLQRVRDEAHRFAITYHRAKRGKRMTTSALDDVPGLGQARRTALIKHFGSVRKLRAASVEEIAEVPGIGQHTAATVHANLAPREAVDPDGNDAPGARNNPSTGVHAPGDVAQHQGAPGPSGAEGTAT